MEKDDVISKMIELHGNDEDQIRFILSEERRLIVTASAGCGKTKSMISKIAYEIINKPDLNFKKFLALTFSVNAAIKIKEDTINTLPILLGDEKYDISKRLEVANYHSFSTKLIAKHGYALHEGLKNIERFKIVPDSRLLDHYLTDSEINYLVDFSTAINEVRFADVDRLESGYIEILNKLISNEVLTYNGLLVLAIKLLDIEPIKTFYRKYYPLIIVDEFQDTNILAFKLIKQLIDQENKIIFIGDDIQTIYGFLGAVPNIFNIVSDEYNMLSIELKTNHRFKDNETMKNLDKYLRKIFRDYKAIDDFKDEATINFGFYKTNAGEAQSIVRNMLEKVRSGNKVALLVRAKHNAENVINKLESEGIDYFNGLFSDTDTSYNHFHRMALDRFIMESGQSKSISKRTIDKVISHLYANKASIGDDIIFNSLLRLLSALFESTKASSLSKEDKYNKIVYILDNNCLKRIMNELEDDIILTTIHGSKGLEWDYVYIPEITDAQFPSNQSLCRYCRDSNSGIKYDKSCQFTFPQTLQDNFEGELSLYYVAITRAKKDVFLFANTEVNRFGYPKRRSCLTRLPNLNLNRL